MFYCIAHEKKGKLDPRSKNGFFLGYPSRVKGYKVWLKGEPGMRVVVSREIVFNEQEMPCLKPISNPGGGHL